MKSTGVIEEGFVLFTAADSYKDVTLQVAKNPAYIATSIVELPDTYNTGSSPDTNTDIPSRYYGTIQIASSWVTSNQFRITTSAPFYGHVRWSVTS